MRPAVRTDLRALHRAGEAPQQNALRQILDEPASRVAVPLADAIAANQRRVRVERDVKILVADEMVVLAGLNARLFLVAERPNFVDLQMAALQLHEVVAEEPAALLAGDDELAQD